MRTFTVTPYFGRRTLTSDLWNEMDQIFNTAVYDDRALNVACDVTENEHGYLVSADMPGVKQDDIKIELKENTLTVSGERKFEAGLKTKSYHRTFTLPKNVEGDKIEAVYENGVLEVFIPKMEAAKPRTISIQSSKKGFLGKLLGSPNEEKEVSHAH